MIIEARRKDGRYDEALLDDSRAQVSIDLISHKAASKDLCTASNKNADADTTKPAYWLIKAPAGKEVHLSAKVSASGAGEAMLYRDSVTVPEGGTKAFTLLNEMRADILVHVNKLTRHLIIPGAGYPPPQLFATEPTTIAALVTMTNWLLLLYKLHDADLAEETPTYHSAQGTAHALESEVDAETFDEACALLNDIKAKYNLHEAETVGHSDVGTQAGDEIAAADHAAGTVGEFGTPFALNYRNHLGATVPVETCFYAQPEVLSEGTQLEVETVPTFDHGSVVLGGVGIVVTPAHSALVKFLPDADNAEAWIVAEYYTLPEATV
jgi:hypothetical protein